MKNQPLVSILINNYNYGSFLREAIDSALNQDYPHQEIIVVDDGSTDDSQAIIASYGDRIIPIFKENGGQASAFNAGFAISQGDIICFLDSDDMFTGTKVTEIVKIFADYLDIGWCFHTLKLIDKNTNKFLGISHGGTSRKCDFRQQMKQGKLPFYAPPTSGLCFRRSLLEQILPMPEMLKRGADRYLVAAAPARDQGFFLERELTIQGIHGNNGNTLRSGKIFQQRRAYKAIVIAYFMQKKFPELTKFTNRMLARGIGIYWQIGKVDRESQQYIDDYFKDITIGEKIFIIAIAIYQLRPGKKNLFYKTS
jgi:glycosyltransferase involved in cell wall biosynthesis